MCSEEFQTRITSAPVGAIAVLQQRKASGSNRGIWKEDEIDTGTKHSKHSFSDTKVKLLRGFFSFFSLLPPCDTRGLQADTKLC